MATCLRCGSIDVRVYEGTSKGVIYTVCTCNWRGCGFKERNKTNVFSMILDILNK